MDYFRIERLVHTKQPFIGNIYYKCNTLSLELKNHQLNTNIWSATIIALMVENYTLDELASLPLEKIVKLYKKKDEVPKHK